MLVQNSFFVCFWKTKTIWSICDFTMIWHLSAHQSQLANLVVDPRQTCYQFEAGVCRWPNAPFRLHWIKITRISSCCRRFPSSKLAGIFCLPEKCWCCKLDIASWYRANIQIKNTNETRPFKAHSFKCQIKNIRFYIREICLIFYIKWLIMMDVYISMSHV